MLTDEELKEMRWQGHLAAEGESEEQFLRRIQKHDSSSHLEGEIFSQARADFYDHFGLWADKVVGKWKSRTLAPWHGALTEVREKGGNVEACIYMRKKIWGYTPQEVLTHELVHYVRAAFPVSAYEEIFAYSTSPKKWRRFVGPFFRYPKQIFLLLLLMTLFDMQWLWGGYFFPAAGALGLYAGSLLLFYLRDLQRLKACKRRLEEIFPGQNALSIALQLTDGEISSFARQSHAHSKEYIAAQYCLRWRQIKSWIGSSSQSPSSGIGKEGVGRENRCRYFPAAATEPSDDTGAATSTTHFGASPS